MNRCNPVLTQMSVLNQMGQKKKNLKVMHVGKGLRRKRRADGLGEREERVGAGSNQKALYIHCEIVNKLS